MPSEARWRKCPCGGGIRYVRTAKRPTPGEGFGGRKRNTVFQPCPIEEWEMAHGLGFRPE
ncbi:hypothetical protein [Neisseria lactamica]|uniref:hypothetical protein n=1 Tax=Neisseria lactamica TaxID=486 RepID=UPI00117C4200|nr:hypothetical protein [Neisseria lactamica]